MTKGIYGNNFILQFMVDNSCGHYQKYEDGLNVNVINVGHGGRQRIMHDSKLTEEIRRICVWWICNSQG